MGNVVKANFKKKEAVAMACTACGSAGIASCDCGAPYTRAGAIAEKVNATNPRKSLRSLAKDSGVSHETIRAARKSTSVNNLTDVETTSLTERAKAAVTDTPGDTNVAIAKRIGVSEMTVRRARLALSSHDEPATREPKRSLRQIAREKKQPIVLLTEAPCDGCNSKQEFWQNSLSSMAGEAISLPAYWKQQFGNWQKFEPTAEMVVLAKQAAEAWNEIVETINRKKER